jgi:hypothetical protein
MRLNNQQFRVTRAACGFYMNWPELEWRQWQWQDCGQKWRDRLDATLLPKVVESEVVWEPWFNNTSRCGLKEVWHNQADPPYVFFSAWGTTGLPHDRSLGNGIRRALSQWSSHGCPQPCTSLVHSWKPHWRAHGEDIGSSNDKSWRWLSLRWAISARKGH